MYLFGIRRQVCNRMEYRNMGMCTVRTTPTHYVNCNICLFPIVSGKLIDMVSSVSVAMVIEI